jgi:phosphoesterase RecJ-like protein
MKKNDGGYRALTALDAARIIIDTERPIVFVHIRPDGDCVGSGAALSEIFHQLGRDCKIISADEIPERLRFILDYSGIEVATEVEGYTPIAIDVASPYQLGDLLTRGAPPVLMIDHHEIGERFADYYTVKTAGSAAEALFDIVDELIKLEKIKMTSKLAYALYAAISSDTGCFAYSSVSEKTHMRAAALIKCGIDAADINHRLFMSKSPSVIKAEGFVASGLEAYADGRVAVATVSLDDMARLGLEKGDFETAIDVVRSLRGVEIAVAIRELEPGCYKVSMRSTGANVAEIAKNFGGGGHIRASGFSVSADSIKEAKEKVIASIPITI